MKKDNGLDPARGCLMAIFLGLIIWAIAACIYYFIIPTAMM